MPVKIGGKRPNARAWCDTQRGVTRNTQRQVKSGEIPQEKTPYMQRGGGAWDDSDLAKKQLRSKEGKKITKKQWSETDKAYAAVRRNFRENCTSVLEQ